MAAAVWNDYLPDDDYITRAVDLLAAATKQPDTVGSLTLDKVGESVEIRAAKAADADYPEAADAAELIKRAFTYVALSYCNATEPTAFELELFDQMVGLASVVLVTTTEQVLDEIGDN